MSSRPRHTMSRNSPFVLPLPCLTDSLGQGTAAEFRVLADQLPQEPTSELPNLTSSIAPFCRHSSSVTENLFGRKPLYGLFFAAEINSLAATSGRLWCPDRRRPATTVPISFHRSRRSVAAGPPAKPSLGGSLWTKKSPAVIDQQTDRLGAAAAKDEHAARKRIACQLLAAQLREPVDTFSSIYGLQRDQNTHLRRDL